MKERPTLHRPRRTRRAHDEAAPDVDRADAAPERSLETLHDPRASHAARSAAALGLQRAVGNAQLARELAQPDATRQVQRYAVPADLECDEVVDWLDTNSPYAPEWAETRSTYAFHGRLRMRFETLPDGQVQAHVSGHAGLRVSVRSPVDRPTWSPSRRPNRAAVVRAWRAMRVTLDAHEQEHRAIAQRERAKAEEQFRALRFSVVGATRDEARDLAVAEVQAQQAQWQADAQAEQDAIDPFRGAVLACPAPPASDGARDGE